MSTRAEKISAILTVIALIATVLIVTITLSSCRRRQLAPIMKCGTGLTSLEKAMLIYANDHNDTLPNSIESLAAFCTEADIHFACPGSGVEFVLVQGRTFDMPDNSVLAYCPKAHHLFDPETEGTVREMGINVLNLDGSVQTLKLNKAIQLFSEQGLDNTIIKHNKPLD